MSVGEIPISQPIPAGLPGGGVKALISALMPTLGRIVLFTPAASDQVDGVTEFVAVIGQVFSDPAREDGPVPVYSNLYVLAPFKHPWWEGAVVQNTGEAVMPRSWRWPPRV